MSDHDRHPSEGSDIANAFYSDGHQLAKVIVGTDLSAKNLYAGVKKLYATIDQFIELFLETAAQEGKSCDCREGCSWCCNQTVYAQTYELEYLRKWSLLYLGNAQNQRITQKAEEKYKLTSQMSREQLHLYKSPCPMLENGACIAYQARPMACRIYLSYQVSTCRYENEHPDDKSHYPALYDLPLKAGKKFNEGFAAWLSEQGQTIEEFTLEEGIMKHQK